MKDKRTQIDKFKEAARAAGCDESEEAFDKVLKKLIKASPLTQEQIKQKAKKSKKKTK